MEIKWEHESKEFFKCTPFPNKDITVSCYIINGKLESFNLNYNSSLTITKRESLLELKSVIDQVAEKLETVNSSPSPFINESSGRLVDIK